MDKNMNSISDVSTTDVLKVLGSTTKFVANQILYFAVVGVVSTVAAKTAKSYIDFVFRSVSTERR